MAFLFVWKQEPNLASISFVFSYFHFLKLHPYLLPPTFSKGRFATFRSVSRLFWRHAPVWLANKNEVVKLKNKPLTEERLPKAEQKNLGGTPLSFCFRLASYWRGANSVLPDLLQAVQEWTVYWAMPELITRCAFYQHLSMPLMLNIWRLFGLKTLAARRQWITTKAPTLERALQNAEE